jgi:hypothetical protein
MIPPLSTPADENYSVYIGAGVYREHGEIFGFGWVIRIDNTGDTNITGFLYVNETTVFGKAISYFGGPFSLLPGTNTSVGGCSFFDFHPINLIYLTVMVGNMTYVKSGYEIGPFVLLIG